MSSFWGTALLGPEGSSQMAEPWLTRPRVSGPAQSCRQERCRPGGATLVLLPEQLLCHQDCP